MTAMLALDLGTKTGWAYKGSQGNVISGTQCFKNDRYSGGGMRYLRFSKWLDELYYNNELHIKKRFSVYFEEVRRHLGVDAAHAYGGFLATLTSWCEEHEIPYQGIPVGTIKKHIAGKGNASKGEVIEAVKALGFHPADDNEADSLALLDYIKATEKSASSGNIR